MTAAAPAGAASHTQYRKKTMSSHHEWADEQMARHDAQKPFAPENGLPLRFQIGGPVIFTNVYGVEFPLRITGFYERPEGSDGQYAHGARYLVNSSSPWFPVKEASLRLDVDALAISQGV